MGNAPMWVGLDGRPAAAAYAHGLIASRFRNRTRLYAVAAKVNCQSTSLYAAIPKLAQVT